MRTKELGDDHKDGPPWNIVGKFSTFEAAHTKRIELFEDLDFQVKIHYQGTENNRYFAVKIRANPAIALEETLSAKRTEKKRRKARLNKKRRKK